MGKVGRNVQVYHRRNMFKVSPEHLRHATLEERAVAQSDGREMLGIAQYVGENGSLQGSHYVDLTQQGSPEGPDSPTAARPTAEHAPSQASSVPSPASAPAQLVSPDNMDVVAPGELVDKSPAEPESVGRDNSCSDPMPAAPFSARQEPSSASAYGPVRYRHHGEKPEPMTTVWRPAELVPLDFREAHQRSRLTSANRAEP